MDPKLDEDLSYLWYDLNSSSAFAGLNKLYAEVKERGLDYSRENVKKWLLAQPSYTLNYPIRSRKFRRNRIISYGIDWCWQMDLAHIPDLKHAVSNYVWLLCVIDTFSKFLMVKPMKTKKAVEVSENLKEILTERNCSALIQSDMGLEFWNKEVSNVLKKFGVHHFGARTEMKASIVERAIRTLKTRIYKYMTKNRQKRQFKTDLQKIVSGINNSIHRSHGMKPSQVTLQNQDIVFERLYPMFYQQKHRFKIPYKVNDKVRIATERQPFGKGYKGTYTKEVFAISEVLKTRVPPVYRLKTLGDETQQVLGIFYADELLKIAEDGPP